jgi:hypothetical protein
MSTRLLLSPIHRHHPSSSAAGLKGSKRLLRLLLQPTRTLEVTYNLSVTEMEKNVGKQNNLG